MGSLSSKLEVLEVIGARDPSMPHGSWTSAYVGYRTEKGSRYCICKNGERIPLEQGKFVEWSEITKRVTELLNEGMSLMTDEDIKQTIEVEKGGYVQPNFLP